MRFGFCTDVMNAPLLQSAGYDYVECNLKEVMRLSDEEIEKRVSLTKSLGFFAESCNCFYGDQIIVGENATPEQELREYTLRGMDRLARMGGRIAVYGSSKARNIPEGFPYEKAYEQFCRAVRMTGEISAQFGIVTVLEPLSSTETNFLHTVKEGLQIMQDVNLPSVRVLADMYHVCQENESFEDIVLAGSDLRHIHIAEPVDRKIPTVSDDFDYGTFAQALHRAGYDARISVEAKFEECDFEKVVPVALATLRKYFL